MMWRVCDVVEEPLNLIDTGTGKIEGREEEVGEMLSCLYFFGLMASIAREAEAGSTSELGSLLRSTRSPGCGCGTGLRRGNVIEEGVLVNDGGMLSSCTGIRGLSRLACD